RVSVATHTTAVLAPAGALAADDHTLDHLARLYVAAGNRFLDAGDNNIAQSGVAPARAAQHLDAHAFLGAGVIGYVQIGIHLNHECSFLVLPPLRPPLVSWASSFN